MKNKLFLAGMLAMALAFGLIMTGCPTEAEEESFDTSALVAKWYSNQSYTSLYLVYEFTSDGKFLSGPQSTDIGNTYKATDADTISISNSGHEVGTFDWEVDGKTLTLTGGGQFSSVDVTLYKK